MGSFLINSNHSKSSLGRGWSITHGFFIVMGGFHLFEHGSMETSNNDEAILHKDDIPLRPLAARDLYGDYTYQSIKAEIDFTSFTVPTEEEINDKGKSDWLAKSLVLLQTSWFVMQSIARAIKHLPVTHLEIVTLAYAVMNFMIYVFWWNKPLNVNRPVRVFRKCEPSETQPQVTESIPGEPGLTLYNIFNVFRRMFIFIAGGQDCDIDLGREDRVPRFWANSTDGEEAIADNIVLGVGVCFGAIHCIAWDFSFPTHTELLIWRISSIGIAAIPIYIPLMLFLGDFLGCLMSMNFKNFIIIFEFSALLSGAIVYILARAVTLVLAFTSLRDLPPGAFETVHWTNFMPHV